MGKYLLLGTVRIGMWVLLLLFCGACSPTQAKVPKIQVQIILPNEKEKGAEEQEVRTIFIPRGGTVQDALTQASLTLGELDRIEPTLETVLEPGEQISLFRVSEKYEIKQVVLPYEQQMVRNQNLVEGEIRLAQAGENGLEEITYRRVSENGVEISEQQVRSVVIKQPLPQILMIGVQQPFTPLAISGKIAYLSGGNAWVMDENTANRHPLVLSGNLDGRIFNLSPDAKWLLFSQRAKDAEKINSLFVIPTDGTVKEPLPLHIDNVIQSAKWLPGVNLRVAYSTVEKRPTAPGWQANNDLFMVDFSGNGWVSKPVQIVAPNSGGVYGWWGSEYVWSPKGDQLVYVRPAEVGLVELKSGEQKSLLKITPYQTKGDWAWMPSVTWSSDGQLLYIVTHRAAPDQTNAESSPDFDLAALTLSGEVVEIVSQTGMFAYPTPSSYQKEESGENADQIAYLQAIFPSQSQTSRYHLIVIDRDGSNKRDIFPPEGMIGLDPQQIFWSPAPLPKDGQQTSEEEKLFIAVIYQGDLWFTDTRSGIAQQITGEGLVSKIDWK